MKKIFLLCAVLPAHAFYAQESTLQNVQKDSTWITKGTVAILGSQSSFSQWQAGGSNNLALNGSLNYDVNYKKDDWVWDNKFIASYGINKLKGEEKRKTDDRLEINSLLGKKAKGDWYYSAFMNFKTQFDAGLNPDNEEERISHFMSPAYLQAGLGMLWKKNDNLKVNIAPATARLIYVHSHFTDEGESFGVEQGKNTRFEFGASVNAYYKLQVMENFTIENILNLYSNYLEDPYNVDLDYQLNAVLKVNKYISTNLTFQAIYDDNAYKGFQTRHTLGLGLNYSF